MKRIVVALFFFALVIRVYSFYPEKIVLGYDQIRDLFTAKSIWYDRDIKIIGPTAGNNFSLHHGVAFWYFLVPPIIAGGGNPLWVSVWNSIFNSVSVIVIYFLSLSLFKNKIFAFISAFISAVSLYFVLFSGWIGNPGPTLLTVPLFFFFIWKFIRGDRWALPLIAFFLGLSIQFELFFIYLIPLIVIVWLIFRMPFPGFRNVFYSLLTFTLVTSTMIATEVKYGFAGVKDIVGTIFHGSSQGAGILNNFKFMVEGYARLFSDSLVPGWLALGYLTALVVLVVLVIGIRDKAKKFLLVYLLSPFVMLIAGFHNAPWFLIGAAPAVAIACGYIIGKIKNPALIILACAFIFFANFGKGSNLLDEDPSSILSKQLEVIDYTYEQAHGEPFAINSVTNPLYINYVWAYNYPWYGGRIYGYLPSWLGSDQLAPFNTLKKSTGKEKYLFLLIDETPRIPGIHKDLAIGWADKISMFIDEKSFDGILVQKRELK